MKSGVAVVVSVVAFASVVVAQPRAFPVEALGFRFGAPAEPVCSAAGGTWTAGEHINACSVVPSPIGHDGTVRVELCEDGVSTCTVTFVSVADDTAAARAWADLRPALTSRYGEPREAISDRCGDRFNHDPSPATIACLTNESRVEARWRISGGAVVLSVLTIGSAHRVTIMYISARSVAESERPRSPATDTRSL